MEKILRFHKNLANVLGALIILIVVIIVVEAGGRFLFNKPLPGPIEASRVILAWILFLSLAYALVQKAHVQVTVILERFSPASRLWAETIIDLVSVGFFVLVIFSGWLQFWDSFKVGEVMAAPIWIPFWLAKLSVPVGCLLFVGQFLVNIFNRFNAPKGQGAQAEKEGI